LSANIDSSSCAQSDAPITVDVQKSILDGSATDIPCTPTWNYNDDFGTTGNPVGANDINVDPRFVNASGGNFTPQNSTVLTHGQGDNVTPYAYLGAVQ